MLSLKHLFTSAKADDADTTLINPSNWNDEHVLEAGANSLIGNPSGVAGEASEIALGTGLSFSGSSVINSAFTPFGAATLANQTGTVEAVIAQWTIPANYLTAGMAFAINFAGQISSTATLSFRMRLGTAGTSADALVASFGTSGAGVSNQHVQGNLATYILSTTTASGSGLITLGGSILAQATGTFAAATIDPSVVNKLSIGVSQSIAQTFTIRAAVLNRIS